LSVSHDRTRNIKTIWLSDRNKSNQIEALALSSEERNLATKTIHPPPSQSQLPTEDGKKTNNLEYSKEIYMQISMLTL
jgi:hypothetical protein